MAVVRGVCIALLLMAAVEMSLRVAGAQDAQPAAPALDAGLPPTADKALAVDGGAQPVDAGAPDADGAAPLADPAGPAAKTPDAVVTPVEGSAPSTGSVAAADGGGLAPDGGAPQSHDASASDQDAASADATPVAVPATEPATATPAAEILQLPAAPQDCEAGAACSGELRARANADWITAVRAVLAARSEGDLLGAQTELRPNLRLEHGTWLQAVAQLRFGLDGATEHEASGWSARRSYIAKVIQLYAQWRFNEHFSLAVGFQSFQWGPAELLTPSNRLFRVLTLLRDPLFVVYGRGLVRVNLSLGKSLSAVILAEVFPNGEPAFVAGQRFERDALAKVEYSTDDGRAYVGLTAGAKQTGRAWFGEYASWSISDGLSIYADASHTVGSEAWYPEQRAGSPTPVFTQNRRESERLHTLALFGARYSFVSGVDVRCEYLLNDAGYKRSDMVLADRAASAIPQHPELAQPYTYAGYEILARHLLYASVRVPDLPPNQRTTLQARYAVSLSDSGGAFVLAITSDIADRHTVFLSALASHGPSYAEIARVARGYAFLGWIVSI